MWFHLYEVREQSILYIKDQCLTDKGSDRSFAKGAEKTFGMIKMFYILIGVMVTLMVIFIKTCTLKIYTFHFM